MLRKKIIHILLLTCSFLSLVGPVASLHATPFNYKSATHRFVATTVLVGAGATIQTFGSGVCTTFKKVHALPGLNPSQRAYAFSSSLLKLFFSRAFWKNGYAEAFKFLEFFTKRQPDESIKAWVSRALNIATTYAKTNPATAAALALWISNLMGTVIIDGPEAARAAKKNISDVMTAGQARWATFSAARDAQRQAANDAQQTSRATRNPTVTIAQQPQEEDPFSPQNDAVPVPLDQPPADEPRTQGAADAERAPQAEPGLAVRATPLPAQIANTPPQENPVPQTGHVAIPERTMDEVAAEGQTVGASNENNQDNPLREETVAPAAAPAPQAQPPTDEPHDVVDDAADEEPAVAGAHAQPPIIAAAVEELAALRKLLDTAKQHKPRRPKLGETQEQKNERETRCASITAAKELCRDNGLDDAFIARCQAALEKAQNPDEYAAYHAGVTAFNTALAAAAPQEPGFLGTLKKAASNIPFIRTLPRKMFNQDEWQQWVLSGLTESEWHSKTLQEQKKQALLANPTRTTEEPVSAAISCTAYATAYVAHSIPGFDRAQAAVGAVINPIVSDILQSYEKDGAIETAKSLILPAAGATATLGVVGSVPLVGPLATSTLSITTIPLSLFCFGSLNDENRAKLEHVLAEPFMAPGIKRFGKGVHRKLGLDAPEPRRTDEKFQTGQDGDKAFRQEHHAWATSGPLGAVNRTLDAGAGLISKIPGAQTTGHVISAVADAAGTALVKVEPLIKRAAEVALADAVVEIPSAAIANSTGINLSPYVRPSIAAMTGATGLEGTKQVAATTAQVVASTAQFAGPAATAIKQGVASTAKFAAPAGTAVKQGVVNSVAGVRQFAANHADGLMTTGKVLAGAAAGYYVLPPVINAAYEVASVVVNALADPAIGIPTGVAVAGAIAAGPEGREQAKEVLSKCATDVGKKIDEHKGAIAFSAAVAANIPNLASRTLNVGAAVLPAVVDAATSTPGLVALETTALTIAASNIVHPELPLREAIPTTIQESYEGAKEKVGSWWKSLKALPGKLDPRAGNIHFDTTTLFEQ